MHMCSAKIALGGDLGNVVHRQEHDPVSWPEISIIQFIHGEESVFDIKRIGDEPATPLGEKRRLLDIYGEVVNALYPGARPYLEMEMPGGEEEAQAAKPRRDGTREYPVKTVAVKPNIGIDKRPEPIPKMERYKDGE